MHYSYSFRIRQNKLRCEYASLLTMNIFLISRNILSDIYLKFLMLHLQIQQFFLGVDCLNKYEQKILNYKHHQVYQMYKRLFLCSILHNYKLFQSYFQEDRASRIVRIFSLYSDHHCHIISQLLIILFLLDQIFHQQIIIRFRKVFDLFHSEHNKLR